MRQNISTLRLVATLITLLSFASCDKKSGEAIVLEKEHIAVRETPLPPSSEPTPGRPEVPSVEEYKPIGPDEITVDQYVMNRAVRGTSRDPRATDREQWVVKVRMVADGRQFNVQADEPQWKKVKQGDRIKVTYRLGKYTGTVWGAEIR